MLRELKQGLKSSQEDGARLRADGQDLRDQLATAQNDAREQHQQQAQANAQLQVQSCSALLVLVLYCGVLIPELATCWHARVASSA